MQILDKPKNTFYSGGITEKAQYHVADTPAMMKILSDSLYSDKIKAVIRELSTNAWDSHIDAGNTTKPFDLHLPTYTDNIFRIRDYGTGLSKQNVLKLYTTYGETNKNHTNKLNGIFGLGSKSPFAYVKSFTTISYFNGIKYTFLNAKDKYDIPTINLLLEEETDEQNGLEISFECESDNIWQWEDKAKDVLKHFPLLPNCNKNVEVSNVDIWLSGDDWEIPFDYQADSCAIMGWIEYPIDSNLLMGEKFESNNEDKELLAHLTNYNPTTNNIYADLLNVGLNINFDIGEIEMSPSRESLQYHKITVSAIKNKLNRILPEIKQKIIDQIRQSKNLLDARIKISTYWSNDRFKQLLKLIPEKFEYNGVELKKDGIIKISDDELNLFQQNIRKFYKSYNSILESNISSPLDLGTYKNNDLNSTTGLFVNDLSTGYIGRCRKAISNNVYKKIYLVNPDFTQEFLDLIGGDLDDLKKVSLLDSPTISTKTRKSVSGQYLIYNSNVNSDKKTDYWDKISVDSTRFQQGGLYLPVFGYQYLKEQHKKCVKTFKYRLDNLKQLGYDEQEIIGVRSKKIHYFFNDPNWTNILEDMDQWTKDYIKNNPQLIEYHYIKKELDHLDKFDLHPKTFITYLNKIENKRWFYKWVSEFQKLKQHKNNIDNKNITNYTTLTSIQNLSDYLRPKHIPYIHKLTQKIIEEYPMLNLLDNTMWSYTQIVKILNYVNLVDQTKKES